MLTSDAFIKNSDFLNVIRHRIAADICFVNKLIVCIDAALKWNLGSEIQTFSFFFKDYDIRKWQLTLF